MASIIKTIKCTDITTLDELNELIKELYCIQGSITLFNDENLVSSFDDLNETVVYKIKVSNSESTLNIPISIFKMFLLTI